PVELLREAGGGGVANGETRPIGSDPIGVRHPHARGGAVPREDHVAGGIDLGEIGKLAVSGLEHCHVGELELLRDIRHPAFPERFPRESPPPSPPPHPPSPPPPPP